MQQGPITSGGGVIPWRSAFDLVEGRVQGPLTKLTTSPELRDTVRIARRTRRTAGRLVDRTGAAVLHQLHLPAYRDVRRISRQLTTLEQRVRELSHQIEQDALPPDDAPVAD
jgi:hypothetical protein